MLHRFVTSGLLAASVAVLGSGCVVEEHHRYIDTQPPPDQASATTEPMLVVIDTGIPMDANPGQGVGVFVEYDAGGSWTLFWTCDTAISGRTCDVSLGISTEGAITGVNADAAPGASVTQPTPHELDVATTTGTELHGIRFHTDPGAVITLDARIGGLDDGSFLFFVQDRKVNGGFRGPLTNPIRFQGKTP